MKLRIPPLVFLLIFGVLAILADSASPLDILLGESRWIFCLIFLISGALIMVLGVREFRRHETTVNPLSPDKASALVQSGVYRFSRNPMYLGMLLALLSVVIYSQDIASLTAVAGFIIAMNRFQIRPEERILEQIFGATYTQYCERTRRWI